MNSAIPAVSAQRSVRSVRTRKSTEDPRFRKRVLHIVRLLVLKMQLVIWFEPRHNAQYHSLDCCKQALIVRRFQEIMEREIQECRILFLPLQRHRLCILYPELLLDIFHSSIYRSVEATDTTYIYTSLRFYRTEHRAALDGTVLAACRDNQLAIQYLIIKLTHLRGESVSLVAYVDGLRSQKTGRQLQEKVGTSI